jgi:hypothetical protein
VNSHFLHMLLYAAIVAVFFAILVRRDRREQVRLGGTLWLVMVGGGMLLAYLMAPFPS